MPEKAEWDWYPYSPRGELTIIGGDPGARKSTLTRYIALATLKGLPLPNDPPGMRRQPGRVLMLSTEDSLTKTVVPQLLKWGATKNDLRRLYLLEEDFTLDAEGVAMVERAIEELEPDMVFLDPIVSFIGSDVDMNSQNQVRNVLRPLAGLAKRHNVPIVTVAHARKSGGRAMHALLGSVDFSAAVRSAIMVYLEEDGTSIMTHPKANLSAKGPSYRFTLDEEEQFQWLGEDFRTADEVAKGGGAEIDRRQRDKAKDFLLAYLPDGAEVRVTQLANEAEQSGITKRTLQRAKEDLGVTSRQLTKKEKLAMGLDPLPPVWVCSLSAERRAQIA